MGIALRRAGGCRNPLLSEAVIPTSGDLSKPIVLEESRNPLLSEAVIPTSWRGALMEVKRKS